MPIVANRVRITYVGLDFTEFRNLCLRHTPSEGIYVFYTSVRDLLHPSVFIDMIITNTRNFESKTDKTSQLKKQQLTACAIRLKSMLS